MRKVVLFVLCFLLVLEAGMMPASANAGSPSYATSGDKTALVPVKNEFIDVLSESLIYTIQQDKTAEVEATYEMTNISPEAQTVLVAFVSGNADKEPEISFDGSPVSITNAPETGAPVEFGSIDTMEQDITNETKLILMYDKQQVQYTYFYLTFEPGKTHYLNVKYTETPTLQKNRIRVYSGYTLPISIYYYFLSPAAYWHSFKDLTVEIKGIGRFDSFKTNFDNFKHENGVYTAHFDQLPDKNLIIQTKTVLDLILDAFLHAKNYLILAAIVAFIVVIEIYIKKRKQK